MDMELIEKLGYNPWLKWQKDVGAYMVTQPLSMFRWRPKQRRMVTDSWRHCKETEFFVKGKGMDVRFVFQKEGIDPGSKTNKRARIYKPHPSEPAKVQDIVLYVRV